MASHVSTCKSFELCINRGIHNQFMAEGEGEKGERRKERKKEEGSRRFLPRYIGVSIVGPR